MNSDALLDRFDQEMDAIRAAHPRMPGSSLYRATLLGVLEKLTLAEAARDLAIEERDRAIFARDAQIDRAVNVAREDIAGTVEHMRRQRDAAIAAYTELSRSEVMLRTRRSVRVRVGKRRQRDNGIFQGGNVPWNCRVNPNGELVVISERQDAIAQMKVLRASGRSLRAIAAEITRSGHSISHAGVKKVLQGAYAALV